jgi:hypothetical protein
MEQTSQSRQGRLKAAYEIQPSLAGLISVVEADPALRAGLLSDVPSGLCRESIVLTQLLETGNLGESPEAETISPAPALLFRRKQCNDPFALPE